MIKNGMLFKRKQLFICLPFFKLFSLNFWILEFYFFFRTTSFLELKSKKVKYFLLLQKIVKKIFFNSIFLFKI